MSDLKIEAIFNAQGVFLYHDLVIENGRFQQVDGIDEIENRIIAGLQTYLAENYTDTSFGTDYYGNIFGRSTDDTVVIDELKSNILRTRGVTGLKTFVLSTTDSDRTATLTAQVETTQGQIDLVTPIIT